MSAAESAAQELYEQYPTLLGKGFALERLPTIQQALSGNIPFSCHSHERLFLKDFVQCVPGTAGGRLAAWLQPESYVSVDNCGVLFRPEEMRCSWPTTITIITRDQYGAVANVPNMKVEVKAVPVDEMNQGCGGGGGARLSKAIQPDVMTFGGHPPPSLENKYEVTVKEKMFYHAITVNKAYDNYSFEELRWASPRLQRQAENMLVRPNGDGTYSASWTPGNVGWYRLSILLDGCELPAAPRLEIQEPPQGSSGNKVPPPTQLGRPTCPSAPLSRLRQFIAKPSAGLRIRLHPTLQSEQIGVVPVDETVSIIDELANSDGLWVRLSAESMDDYCNSGPYPEAWCLQYHQHYERQLMKQVAEPVVAATAATDRPYSARPAAASKKQISSSAAATGGDISFIANDQRLFHRHQSAVKRVPGMYTVVKCGASGHNIRCAPSLNAAAIGMLSLGDNVMVAEVLEGASGECWVRLERDSVDKFCFGMVDGEIWSLAVTSTDTHYLESEAEIQEQRWPEPTVMSAGGGGCGDGGPGFSEPRTGVSNSLFSFGNVWGPACLYTVPSTASAAAAGFLTTTTTPFSPMDSSMGSPRSLDTPSSPASTPVHQRKSLPRPTASRQGSTPQMARHNLFQGAVGGGAPAGVPMVQGSPTAPPSRGRSGTLERKSFFQKWFKTDSGDGALGGVSGGRRNSGSASPPPPERRKSSVGNGGGCGAPAEVLAVRKPVLVNKDIPPELQGVSVKELVKVIGASRANGNGVTPPSTPGTPRKSRSISPAGPVSQLAFSRSR
jgi:hypothetical protein